MDRASDYESEGYRFDSCGLYLIYDELINPLYPGTGGSRAGPKMPSPTLYAFVDGGYLRAIGDSGGRHFCNPTHLAEILAAKCGRFGADRPWLARTIYFDAEPEEEIRSKELINYWNGIERLQDTHLGFGWVRGKNSKRGPRQKAVDTLLAVEMVSGAYNHVYDVALLIASDGDFVPAVNEVRRAGRHVVVACVKDDPALECSDELRRAADRFLPMPSRANPTKFVDWFRPIEG